MSTEEREVWIRAYCAALTAFTTAWVSGGDNDHVHARSKASADKALENFNARFNKEPAGYREPAR